MAEERVDRARKMVRRISSRKERRFAFHITYVFAFFFGFIITDPTAEIICQSTRCTASPSFSSTSTGHISPLCVFSTNASDILRESAKVTLTADTGWPCWHGRSVHPAARPHRPRRDPVPPRGRAHDVSRADVGGRVAPACGGGAARRHARRVRRGGEGVRGRGWDHEAGHGGDEGGEEGRRGRVGHIRGGRSVGDTEAVGKQVGSG